jgi:hypothetical protein
MSAAATLFQEELRKSQARGDTRADAVALNAVIRAHGVPRAVFGPPNVGVGHSAGGRAELCVLGLHRHFLSAASYTVQGVESILVVDGAHCEDLGERVYLPAADHKVKLYPASKPGPPSAGHKGLPLILQ